MRSMPGKASATRQSSSGTCFLPTRRSPATGWRLMPSRSMRVAMSGAPAADSQHQPSTFCNPLSLPNYPVGVAARGVKQGDPDPQEKWKTPHKEQFRELADVTPLWHDDRWYLYPSVDMAWVSADRGASWQHHPLNVRDIGYAPTIVRHRGKFLLLASGSPIYQADSPLGPFTKLGSIRLVRSGRMSDFVDPMLFESFGTMLGWTRSVA